MNNKNRIKKLREEKKMSLNELGKLIGKDASTIHRYENDKNVMFDSNVFLKLAEVLQVPPAYLIGWTDSLVNEVAKIPLIESYLEDAIIVNDYIEIALPTIPSSQLSFIKQIDKSMEPEISKDTLVLINSDINPSVEGLVAILPDNENKPLIRLLKFEGGRGLFVAHNNYDIKIYSDENATIIGEVVVAYKIHKDF